MDIEVNSEQAAAPVSALARLAPATFRGVDCAVLAERYAAYRRDKGLDVIIIDPDVITPAGLAASLDT